MIFLATSRVFHVQQHREVQKSTDMVYSSTQERKRAKLYGSFLLLLILIICETLPLYSMIRSNVRIYLQRKAGFVRLPIVDTFRFVRVFVHTLRWMSISMFAGSPSFVTSRIFRTSLGSVTAGLEGGLDLAPPVAAPLLTTLRLAATAGVVPEALATSVAPRAEAAKLGIGLVTAATRARTGTALFGSVRACAFKLSGRLSGPFGWDRLEPKAWASPSTFMVLSR